MAICASAVREFALVNWHSPGSGQSWCQDPAIGRVGQRWIRLRYRRRGPLSVCQQPSGRTPRCRL